MTSFHPFAKPLLAASLGLTLLASPLAVNPARAEEKALKGSIIHSDQRNNDPSVNPDDIKAIEEGTTLDMVVSTALSTGVNTEGDEFFAKVVKDYKVDGKTVIPRDTLVHGTVTQSTDPKRAGRNAWMVTKFDYMVTPDGREIPIEGKFSNRDSKGKAAAKVVGRAAGYTAVGGVVGALMVLKYGGLAAVAASNGYALAGGAAVGGAAGLTTAMVKKGSHKMIQPGAEIRVKLSEPLKLPTMNMPDAEDDNLVLEGLDVKVLGLRHAKDPFGEQDEMTLTLDITNHTENSFSSFDIGLQDEYGNVFYPSPFGDTGMWFKKLTPNAKLTTNVSFSVDSAKRMHYLVFFKQYTRQPLAKYAITDAVKEVDKKTQKQMLSNKKTAASDF